MIPALTVAARATMRGLIAAARRRDPGIAVDGQATCAAEARQAIKTLNPDVITLDIEMPAMNGLEFLEKIMRLRPMPVVMVSTLTSRGAEATLEALELGAFDCVAKPSVAGIHAFDALAATVRERRGVLAVASGAGWSAGTQVPSRTGSFPGPHRAGAAFGHGRVGGIPPGWQATGWGSFIVTACCAVASAS